MEKYQDFFDFMLREYNLTLTQTEMFEILRESEKLRAKLQGEKKDEKELIEWIIIMHLQNNNNIFDSHATFCYGVECAVKEIRELKLILLDDVEHYKCELCSKPFGDRLSLQHHKTETHD
jgi:hypothetical protein